MNLAKIIAGISLTAVVILRTASIAQATSGDAVTAQVAKWTASDAPYTAKMNEIIKLHMKGVSTDVLLATYKADSDLKPKDSIAQYGYVLLLKWKFEEQNPSGGTMSYDLAERLKAVDPGNVHILTREEYILTQDAEYIMPIQVTETVGEALLKFDPHDRPVYRALIYELRDTRGGDDDGIRYAKQWLAWDDANPDPHLLIGDIYMGKWLFGKQKDNDLRDKFVAELRTVIRTAPRNSADTSIAKRFLTASGIK